MLCLRIDLDYVPWDSHNANLYGHGEPAMILRLLAFARETGLKFHFFVSNRSLRTFPTTADAILGEAHDLDWLTSNPGNDKEFAEAKELFGLAGHKIVGVAYSGIWPSGVLPDRLQFLSAQEGHRPEGFSFFPASGRLDDDSIRSLADGVTVQTFIANPQILAKTDPMLARFEKFAKDHAQLVTTLRGAAFQ